MYKSHLHTFFYKKRWNVTVIAYIQALQIIFVSFYNTLGVEHSNAPSKKAKLYLFNSRTKEQ